jgi:hypothetical protein
MYVVSCAQIQVVLEPLLSDCWNMEIELIDYPKSFAELQALLLYLCRPSH